jgi:cellobiose transport system substrate-binding protein
MKRIISFWLSLSIVAALLFTAGCSSATSGTEENVNDNNEKITLTLWYWNRSIDDDLLAKVGEQFPHIELKAEKIGGDFKAKLMTTLAAGSGGPDIVGLNSWVAEFFPNADKFVNLYEYGADELKPNYLEWKWNQAVTPDGKSLLALPMDTGPTALFYREDLFAKAGLPTDPAEVSQTISTWDDYLEAAKKLQSATDASMFDNIDRVFTQVTAQSDKVYFEPTGEFIGDGPHIRKAWDYAAAVSQQNLSAGVDSWTPEWNAMMNNGDVASFIGAVWMKNVLKDAAPDTAGKWRIARAPGGDGNNGGSFIAITKQSKHPKEAYEVIKWLMSPEHQLNSLVTMDLFPATPSVFDNEKMVQPEEFFGGQATNEVFMESAKNVKPAFFGSDFSIADTIFKEELSLVAKQDKDPDQAWQDAIDKINKELKR